MPSHQHVRAWITHNYQRPAIDQEWLADCSDWLSSELGLDPTRDFDQFIQHVEAQLLQSNLADSTVPGSGIDPLLVASNPGQARPRPSSDRQQERQAPRQKKTTGATPLLVEIKSITEIAHSAFSLLNTHQARLDRADLGLAQEDNAEQQPNEDEGPVPRFPRGMLKFELSDGLTTFRAIEFRSLPQLELGRTPLGYKMFLKATPIRNGVAFLEPSNVILRGYRTEDHDVNSEQVFLSLLRKRLGRPDPPLEAPVAAQLPVNPPQPAPAQPARQHQPPSIAQPPSPPADIDAMYADDDVDPDVLREMTMQIDKAADLQEGRRVGIRTPFPVRPSASKENPATSSKPKQTLRVDTAIASPSLKSSPNTSSVKSSPYFTPESSEYRPVPDIGLSPRPTAPPETEPNFDITWSVNDLGPSEQSVKKIGSTSARQPPSASAQHGPPKKQISSPDSYDDFSFDMDVDDSFLEQVGMIERGALGMGANDKAKGKNKDLGTEGRRNVASAGKTPSGSALGTNLLAHCPVSSSSAELGTMMQSSTKKAIGASSLSGLTESPMPESSQSSDRHLARDPSLIVISSSEDEVPSVRNTARLPGLPWRRRNKRRETDQHEVVDSGVIDISD